MEQGQPGGRRGKIKFRATPLYRLKFAYVHHRLQLLSSEILFKLHSVLVYIVVIIDIYN